MFILGIPTKSWIRRPPERLNKHKINVSLCIAAVQITTNKKRELVNKLFKAFIHKNIKS